MRRSEAFPSNWLGKDDVSSPAVLTIKDVTQQMVKGDNGDERKTVMHFSDFEKGMILNNINWQVCEDAYGEESDDWRGKRVEVYVDPTVMFGGKRVGGVRLRLPQNGHAAAPTAPAGQESYESVRAVFDAIVAKYGTDNPSDAYKPGEADEVFRKVMGELYPNRRPSTLNATEWSQAKVSLSTEFSPSTRALLPF